MGHDAAGQNRVSGFINVLDRAHRREIFLASADALGLPDFVVESEPDSPKIDYSGTV